MRFLLDMKSFVAVLQVAEFHVDWWQDNDLVPGDKNGSGQGSEGRPLELKGHCAAPVDQDVEPVTQQKICYKCLQRDREYRTGSNFNKATYKNMSFFILTIKLTVFNLF